MLKPDGKTFPSFSGHGYFKEEGDADEEDWPDCSSERVVLGERVVVQRIAGEKIRQNDEQAKEVGVGLQDFFDYIWCTGKLLTYTLLESEDGWTCLIPATDNA